jgi:UDP-N-acetylmuramate--alanine ligase
MKRAKNIHFIGIGGSGMNGIAEVLLHLGYNVSGSDKSNNAATDRLSLLGARIFQEHAAVNVAHADVVVISSAIQEENPELQAARAARLPVLPRAQMLAELMRFHYGIAIAGTHGKTTTTSLVASVLAEGGLDPTFVIGGLLNSVGSNARLGSSRYFVVEADESDASFLLFNPAISVITNIDADHMQTYDNDFDKLKKAFVDFAHRLPFYGTLVACTDNAVTSEILPQISRSIITYGFRGIVEGAAVDPDIYGMEYKQVGWKTSFKVRRTLPGANIAAAPLEITLNLPGKHNALNALSAIAIATELGVDDVAMQNALYNFRGVGRRQQIYGTLQLPHGKAILIDDYGHHPEEIKVTLQALRAAWPEKRLVLAFQPHRFSRTRALFDDFAAVLAEVDMLLLLDIYAAGEQPIAGITGKSLARSIRQRGKVDPVFVGDVSKLAAVIADVVGGDDILLLQGAGSIGALPKQLLSTFPHE